MNGEGPPPGDASGRLLRNTAAQYVTPAVRVGLGLAQAAVLARYLGVSGLGQYAVVVAFVTTVNGVINDVGLGTILLREIAQRPLERTILVPSAAALQVLVSGGSYLMLVGLAVALRYPPVVVSSIAIYGLVLPLVAIDLLATPFQADLELSRLVGLGVLGVCLNFVLVVGVAAIHGPLQLLVAANLVALLVQYGLLARLSLAKLGPDIALRVSEWRPLLRESIPLGLTSSITTLTQQAPILALSLLTFNGAGLYNAANRIPQQLLLIPLSLRVSTFPSLSREWAVDRARFRAILDQLLAAVSVTVVPLVVLGMALSSDAMTVLFGSPFRAAGLPFALLLATFGLISVGLIFGEALNAAGLQRLNLATVVATAPVMVVLLFALTPGGGAIGAATASLGYYLVLVGATVLVAGRRLAATAALRHLPIGLAAALVGLSLASISWLPAPSGAVLGALASLALLVAWNRRVIKELSRVIIGL